jgi:hypothetical protein
VHPRQGGIQRAADVGRDFVKALSFVEALVDNFTLCVGQLPQEFLTASGVFARHHAPHRIVGIRFGFRRLGGHGSKMAASERQFPPRQHGLVVSHGEKPATQMSRIDAVQTLQGLDKGFLKSVLGLVMIAQYADEEEEKGTFVAGKELVQRALVSRAEALNQLSIPRAGHPFSSIIMVRRGEQLFCKIAALPLLIRIPW